MDNLVSQRVLVVSTVMIQEIARYLRCWMEGKSMLSDNHPYRYSNMVPLFSVYLMPSFWTLTPLGVFRFGVM